MRVLIVSREFPPETLWGGIGTFTFNLAKALKSIGVEVEVLSFTLRTDDYNEIISGIKVHRISSPRFSKKKSYWDIVQFALSPFAILYSKKIYNKIVELNKIRGYEIIDFPEHIGEGFYTIFKGNFITTVRLYTPLSLIGKLGLNKTTNKFDYWIISLLERFSIKKSTGLNSPSLDLVQKVFKYFKLEKNYDLIRNPIDTEKFSPDLSKVKVNSFVEVLYVGGLTDRKGVHILAQALVLVDRICKNVRYTFVGRDNKGVLGYDSMKEYVMMLARNNNLSSKVNIKNPVAYDMLPELYKSYDLFIAPSLYDNSPYTCLEAMSCGLPVIASDSGGIKEYVLDSYTGYIFKSGDVEDLASKIIKLIMDSDDLIRMSANARMISTNNYGYSEIAKLTLEHYKKVISSKL